VNLLLAYEKESEIEEVKKFFEGKSNYTVYTAENEDQVKDAIMEHELDLVIMDMESDESDSYRMMRSIQAYTNLPIIIVTENKEMDVVRRAAGLGIQDYLVKPFLPQALLDIIHNVLQPPATFNAYNEFVNTRRKGREESDNE
jgi:DNA-binding response OmpR family regulator